MAEGPHLISSLLSPFSKFWFVRNLKKNTKFWLKILHYGVV